MIGICDTCRQTGELFRLIGRGDRSCSACSADIAMIASLYDRIKKASHERTVELERQIAPILVRLLERKAVNHPVDFVRHTPA